MLICMSWHCFLCVHVVVDVVGVPIFETHMWHAAADDAVVAADDDDDDDDDDDGHQQAFYLF